MMGNRIPTYKSFLVGTSRMVGSWDCPGNLLGKSIYKEIYRRICKATAI